MVVVAGAADVVVATAVAEGTTDETMLVASGARVATGAMTELATQTT